MEARRLYNYFMGSRDDSPDSEHTVVKAVVWDYDGTLVDTRRKNLQVTRALLPAVSGRPLASFPGLASLEAYEAAIGQATNWRELFGGIFGLSEAQVNEAGRLWTTYQLRDGTQAPFFEGVSEALARLAGLPQAIFSQSSRPVIEKSVAAAGLGDYFALIVGYEEVAFDKQKPAPDGLLLCLNKMGVEKGLVFYVGDHDTDIECARQASAALAQNGSEVGVVAVGAVFGGQEGPAWAKAPDYVAMSPVDVAERVERMNLGG